MMGLLNKILSNKALLENLIAKSEILVKEPRLNPWLARILVSELLIGRKTLNGSSKPVECVLSYHDDLLKIFNDCQNDESDKTLKLNQQNNNIDIKGNCEILTSFFLFTENINKFRISIIKHAT